MELWINKFIIEFFIVGYKGNKIGFLVCYVSVYNLVGVDFFLGYMVLTIIYL